MNNKGTTLVALAILVFPGLSTAGDADADAGKAKAEPCMECHYADDFAGESKDAIQALIKNSASDGSEHPSDNKGLSEEDLADIAAFFARGE